MSTNRAELERQGAIDLAINTWDEVYGENGEEQAAYTVTNLGLERLAHLSEYDSSEHITEIAELQTAIRRLRVCMDQRAKTAVEFLDQIAESVRP